MDTGPATGRLGRDGRGTAPGLPAVRRLRLGQRPPAVRRRGRQPPRRYDRRSRPAHPAAPRRRAARPQRAPAHLRHQRLRGAPVAERHRSAPAARLAAHRPAGRGPAAAAPAVGPYRAARRTRAAGPHRRDRRAPRLPARGRAVGGNRRPTPGPCRCSSPPRRPSRPSPGCSPAPDRPANPPGPATPTPPPHPRPSAPHRRRAATTTCCAPSAPAPRPAPCGWPCTSPPRPSRCPSCSWSQRAMLPDTGPMELAEVLLGGLLRQLPGTEDQPCFAYSPRMQDLLLSALDQDTAGLVLKHCSAYVERHFGKGTRNFAALAAARLADHDPAAGPGPLAEDGTARGRHGQRGGRAVRPDPRARAAVLPARPGHPRPADRGRAAARPVAAAGRPGAAAPGPEHARVATAGSTSVAAPGLTARARLVLGRVLRAEAGTAGARAEGGAPGCCGRPRPNSPPRTGRPPPTAGSGPRPRSNWPPADANCGS